MKTFETSAVIAPTAKPGHRAERVAGEQHDVGGRLDVRDRREREPADHRQRGERRHQREHAGGRAARARTSAKPAARPSAEHQRTMRAASSRRQLPRSRSAPRAASGSSAGAAGDARDLGGEVPAAGRAPRPACPSAITSPWPISTTRSANAAANSVSWVATTTAAPAAASSASARRQRLLVDAVHPARRLVEQDGRDGPRRQHDLEREPLALAAGQVARVRARRGPSSPAAATPSAPGSSPTCSWIR